MEKKIEQELNFNFSRFLTARNRSLLTAVSLSFEKLSSCKGLKELLSLLFKTYERFSHSHQLSYNSILPSVVNAMMFSEDKKYIHTHCVIVAFYLLDAVIKYVPNFCISFNLEQPIYIYLKNLREYIIIQPATTIKVSKLENNLIVCSGNSKKVLYINLNEQKNEKNIPFDLIAQPISGLPHPQLSRIDTRVDIKTFESMVSKSLLEILQIDKQLYESMLEIIDSIIIIQLPDNIPSKEAENYSVSFSQAENIGAIFVSFTKNHIWLAETLVHEFGHNLLNILMLSTNLVANETTTFYSPWKDMPRSAHGLLHALFSFSYAATFMGKLLISADFQRKEFIEDRLITHTHRLKLAFDQNLEDSLTEKGKKVYHTIQHYFLANSSASFLNSPCPEKLLIHKNRVLQHISKVGT